MMLTTACGEWRPEDQSKPAAFVDVYIEELLLFIPPSQAPLWLFTLLAILIVTPPLFLLVSTLLSIFHRLS